MKVETTAEIDSFKPIELKITIESEEELCNLWNRINTCSNYIPIGGFLKHECIGATRLWEELERLVIKNNLYK
tara:strand:+ start:553 stop:771 length:219 start_codon:yes stop_codon:yes gene_type:complete